MKVTLDDKTKEYLAKKNKNVLTLFVRRTSGGWCGSISVPEIAHEVPEVLSGYHEFDIDGITVYIAKSAVIGSDHVKFVLKNFLFIKEIVAYGLNIPGI